MQVSQEAVNALEAVLARYEEMSGPVCLETVSLTECVCSGAPCATGCSGSCEGGCSGSCYTTCSGSGN